MHSLAFLRIFKLAALGLALAAPLAAQNALYVEHGDSFRLVRKVVDHTPYIEVDAKLIPASGTRYVMKKVDDFVPVVVAVRNRKISFTRESSFDSAEPANKDFRFQANVESPSRLDNVFIVIDLMSEKTGQLLYAQELGRLSARLTQPVALTVPLVSGFGEGTFSDFHFFVDGVETFHSGMDAKFIEKAIDHMIAKHSEGVKDAMPTPFIRPAPVYPEALRKSYPSGKAVISFVIATDGRVRDPQVKSASDPAFGEAALAAIKQWRFMPRVKDGQVVELKTEMPFSFGPSAGK